MGKKKQARAAKAGLVVPWNVLSSLLGIVALASLGTLAVITSVKNVDTLSTVALALSVLSFAAQLIVTMAQAQQSAQVNADTKAALADMRATTSSLLTNQTNQFDAVLKAALRQAVPEAVEDVERAAASSQDGDAETDLSQELQTAIEARVAEALRTPLTQVANERKREQNQRVRAREESLVKLPSEEEGAPVAKDLAELPPRTIAYLGRLIQNSIRSMRADGAVAYRRTEGGVSANAQALVDKGLLEVVSSNPVGQSGRVVYRLTERGWIAARLLHSRDNLPSWASDLLN